MLTTTIETIEKQNWSLINNDLNSATLLSVDNIYAITSHMLTYNLKWISTHPCFCQCIDSDDICGEYDMNDKLPQIEHFHVRLAFELTTKPQEKTKEKIHEFFMLHGATKTDFINNMFVIYFCKDEQFNDPESLKCCYNKIADLNKNNELYFCKTHKRYTIYPYSMALEYNEGCFIEQEGLSYALLRFITTGSTTED